MSENNKQFSLINIDFQKQFPEATKKVDTALCKVMDISGDFLSIILKDNEYIHSFKSKFLEKIKHIPNEEIVQIVPDIGVPILEKTSYTTSEMKLEAFAESLKKAASIKETNCVHPSLITILVQLTDDDLGFLINIGLKKAKTFPYIKFESNSKCKSYSRQSREWYLYNTNVKDLDITLASLKSLGLVNHIEEKWADHDTIEFERHEKALVTPEKTLNKAYYPKERAFPIYNEIVDKVKVIRCSYELSSLGKLLLNMIGTLKTDIKFIDGLITNEEAKQNVQKK